MIVITLMLTSKLLDLLRKQFFRCSDDSLTIELIDESYSDNNSVTDSMVIFANFDTRASDRTTRNKRNIGGINYLLVNDSFRRKTGMLRDRGRDPLSFGKTNSARIKCKFHSSALCNRKLFAIQDRA